MRRHCMLHSPSSALASVLSGESAGVRHEGLSGEHQRSIEGEGLGTGEDLGDGILDAALPNHCGDLWLYSGGQNDNVPVLFLAPNS